MERQKLARLPIRKTPSGKWCYDLPPSMSETGRRQRKTFSSKEKARLSRDADLRRHNLYGIEAHSISASLSQDASKAAKVLEEWNVSLLEAAKFYCEHRTRQSSSIAFKDLWLRFEESRELKSQAHRLTLEKLGQHLNILIGDKLVCDIDHAQLRSAIRRSYKTAHGFNLALRSVSPAFNMAVREGWCMENPCKRIEPIDTGRKKAIECLGLGQCRKLISSCRDYRGDESLPELLRVDASNALSAIAIMLFAGVRPTETTRLEWDDIDLEEGTILVRNTKAKTDRSRFFVIPDTLKAWLELIPPHQRSGKICPPNWKRINQAIRKKTGIDKGGRDQLRKTFATMHLARYGDVNLTRSILGHEAGDVLFTNYRGLVKPKTAKAFWLILPSDSSAELSSFTA